ncbi:MAG: M20/M25/M40 family metallo-hydrolase [Desulfobacterota bacterium]|nr:M20/M25/M40 family metallo-hydrolase [Thermodesulfobacteriota bacterium]
MESINLVPDRRLASSALIRRIHDHIDENFTEHLERCRAFLRQKSVSATGEGIRETARIVREFIREIGGEAEFHGDEDFPIVLGRVNTGSPRTLIIYGMYDVQPAEEEKWTSPPFGAEIKTLPNLGPCVIARGAVNSKGALAGLFNALKSIVESDRLPLNLLFTIEGEEEIGSPHFEPFIREHRNELKGIGAVDFDFNEDSNRKVSLHLGLKGIVYLDLICRGGKKGGPTESIHGSVSAWIASPVWRLVHALATLVDDSERITIEGFYENVAPLTATDLDLLKRLAESFDERAFLREMKALSFKYRLKGVDLLRKGLFDPIINIDGIHAGYYGKGTKTVLPRSAVAKLDIRFGPNMEPEEVIEKFKRHLIQKGFDDIDVIVRDNYTWSKTDFHETLVQKFIATYKAFGRDPEIWPMATWAAPYFVFSRILRIPVVSGGLGHGGRQHSSDEYMTIEGLRDFEKFVATFLYQLSE